MLQMIFSHQWERGSAAITAVIAMIMLGLLGSAFVALSTTELRIATAYRDGVAAQYLAEAGVLYARIRLRSDVDPALRTYLDGDLRLTKTVDKTPGRYTVTISRVSAGSPNVRKIVSTGTVNDAKRTVSLTLDLSQNSLGLPEDAANIIFNNALFSGGMMEIGRISSGYNITGDIRSNDSITTKGTAIYGNITVTAPSKINTDANRTVTGTITTNATAVSYPLIDSTTRFPYLANSANIIGNAENPIGLTITTTNASNYPLGKHDPDPAKAKINIYFIYGDLLFSNGVVMKDTAGNIGGNGIFYVTGRTTNFASTPYAGAYLENNVQAGRILIISEKNIGVKNGAVFDTALLVAAGQIKLEQNVTVSGIAACEGKLMWTDTAKETVGLFMENNAKLTYNKALVDFFKLSTSGGITSWSNF